jgi:hypothetical protein
LLAEWLELLGNLGRAHATLDAYARGVSHFLAYRASRRRGGDTRRFVSLHQIPPRGHGKDRQFLAPPTSQCHSPLVRTPGIKGATDRPVAPD